jgi:hypothetical protein
MRRFEIVIAEQPSYRPMWYIPFAAQLIAQVSALGRKLSVHGLRMQLLDK